MNDILEIMLPTTFDHGFDYRVPEGMDLKNGDIVTVPFGRGKETLGVVWGKGQAKIDPAKLKSISAHHSVFPALSGEMHEFIRWAAWYNCAPIGAMLKMVLPIAEIEKEGRIHLETAIDSTHIELAPLSESQKKSARELEEKIGKGFSVTLLDGVTGSGKTEVYFDAIAHALRIQDSGSRIQAEKISASPESWILNPESLSQILVLLPEIGLSVQWLERFTSRFGFTPIVWNSEITPARKRAGWQAIAKGDARVIVGARSALFLPYKNLSLIIVDEEHDASYKQEDGVMYHARDMAVARGRLEKLPVILVSATPSLESHYNARQGKYTEVSLPARHNEALLPDVDMLDMRKVAIERGAFISEPLRKALAETIADGHQAMLFLNRRGYAPLMLCRHCGYRFECPECSAWMVVHKKKGVRDSGFGIRENDLFPNPKSPIPKSYLQCHHCNYRIPQPDTCPACASKETLVACGPGVERLREEVAEFLPQARVAVMASDSTDSYREISDTISAMSERKIDLLIGTQMIAKGHHFAGLAVVGVVDADLGLAGGDLRAAERTYQLLHQLSGRAGREKIAGRVYLQSYLPEHPVMKALLSGDRDKFLSAELEARERAHMPPFSRLAAIIVEGEKEEQVVRTAKNLAQSAGFISSKIHLYGPAPAPLVMLRGKYRHRLLIKAAREINLPDTMRQWVAAQDCPSSVRIKIDMDPQSFL